MLQRCVCACPEPWPPVTFIEAKHSKTTVGRSAFQRFGVCTASAVRHACTVCRVPQQSRTDSSATTMNKENVHCQEVCEKISPCFISIHPLIESSSILCVCACCHSSNAQNDTGVISFNDNAPSLVKKPVTASLDKVMVRALPLQEHGTVRPLPTESSVNALVGAAKASNLHVHNDNDDETSKIVFQEVRNSTQTCSSFQSRIVSYSMLLFCNLNRASSCRQFFQAAPERKRSRCWSRANSELWRRRGHTQQRFFHQIHGAATPARQFRKVGYALGHAMVCSSSQLLQKLTKTFQSCVFHCRHRQARPSASQRPRHSRRPKCRFRLSRPPRPWQARQHHRLPSPAVISIHLTRTRTSSGRRHPAHTCTPMLQRPRALFRPTRRRRRPSPLPPARVAAAAARRTRTPSRRRRARRALSTMPLLHPLLLPLPPPWTTRRS